MYFDLESIINLEVCAGHRSLTVSKIMFLFGPGNCNFDWSEILAMKMLQSQFRGSAR
jgi:hypothetical protein